MTKLQERQRIYIINIAQAMLNGMAQMYAQQGYEVWGSAKEPHINRLASAFVTSFSK